MVTSYLKIVRLVRYFNCSVVNSHSKLEVCLLFTPKVNEHETLKTRSKING